MNFWAHELKVPVRVPGCSGAEWMRDSEFFGPRLESVAEGWVRQQCPGKK